jgi:hypothetical protein
MPSTALSAPAATTAPRRRRRRPLSARSATPAAYTAALQRSLDRRDNGGATGH